MIKSSQLRRKEMQGRKEGQEQEKARDMHVPHQVS